MTKNLLPHYYKKIALALFVLGIAGWILKITNPHLLELQPFVLGWTLKMLLFASLLCFVFSREKLETERISQLRINSLFTAVHAGGFLLIFEYFAEVLFEGQNAEMPSGYQIMTFMLLMYYITFFLRKNMKTVPDKENSK